LGILIQPEAAGHPGWNSNNHQRIFKAGVTETFAQRLRRGGVIVKYYTSKETLFLPIWL
jgi:hypothetical protein